MNTVLRPLLLLGLVVALACAAPARPSFFLRDGDRVLFLGDSITQAGAYIQYLDAYLSTRFPEQRFELVNLGLASETVTGLSEPDHPFPRPDVFERLERALAQVKPTVVVACYGMNDGIYYPFSEERFAAYRERTHRLVERCRAAGVRVALMTPPPFEPEPVRSKLLPAGAPKYSWLAPYEGYDGVLGRYSDWLLTLRGSGLAVVDLHGPINRFLRAARKEHPGYHVTADGIHPRAAGHWLIARELLRAWNAPREVDSADIDARSLEVRSGPAAHLAREGDGVRFTFTTRLPLAPDPQWRTDPAADRLGWEAFDRQVVRVRGLKPETAVLYEAGRRIAETAVKGGSAELDLTRSPELSTNRRAAEVLKLVQEEHRLLDPAWLSAVGHKRPGVAKGLPLDEGKRKAAALDARVREIARPSPVRIEVLR